MNPLLHYNLEDLRMICFDEKKVTIILRKNSPKEFVFSSKEQLDAAVEEWLKGRKTPSRTGAIPSSGTNLFQSPAKTL